MTRASRVRAAIAIGSACVVVLCSLMSLRHEASVAHVIDTRTGVTQHAQQIGCDARGATQAHLHALPGGQTDPGECMLSAALRHAAAIANAPPIVALAAIHHDGTTAAIAEHHVQTPLLRSAPKTSPPRRV